MPWIISPGWKVGKVDRPATNDDGYTVEFLVVSPAGEAVSTGFAAHGKKLAEMIVQGMNEAAETPTNTQRRHDME